MIAEITLETVSLIYYVTVLMKFLTEKKFTNIFNYSHFSEFFSEELLQKQVISEYNEKTKNLDEDNPFYFSIRENIEQKYEEDLEAAELFF